MCHTGVRNAINLLPNSGRFQSDGLVVSLEDMTAKDYVESDQLDLDHLSMAQSNIENLDL
jgi:hypothetical protein